MRPATAVLVATLSAAPLRITSPGPCVLRLERGDQLAWVEEQPRICVATPRRFVSSISRSHAVKRRGERIDPM
jgi:hypothetical protein